MMEKKKEFSCSFQVQCKVIVDIFNALKVSGLFLNLQDIFIIKVPVNRVVKTPR